MRTIIIPWRHATFAPAASILLSLLGSMKCSSSKTSFYLSTATAYSHPKYETFITILHVRNFNPIKNRILMCEYKRLLFPRSDFDSSIKCKTNVELNLFLTCYRMLSNTSTIKFMVRWHIFHISMWETKWLFEIRHQINNQALSNNSRNFVMIVSASLILARIAWNSKQIFV